MSDSLVFDFKKSPTFLEQFNLKFTVAQMNGTTNNFRLVLVSDCSDDISGCINNSGNLNGTQTNLTTLNCALNWEKVNSDTANITLGASVTYNLSNDLEMLRGVFLTNSSSYVIGYCIFNKPVQITNKVIFDEDFTFWSIREGRGV